ncbi:MAG: prepilin-type N-terminal cleavage/methylation domain-containing protein [Verrucomicrobia bacterium]|nr:prepilin-type N-terminal cleavage/methylation domain-containing protein [Verrucomicrobiota bacterium]
MILRVLLYAQAQCSGPFWRPARHPIPPEGIPRRAFTLVELLAVTAIVGILAMLILGAFVGARRKALQARCASNLRQLGVALNQFVGDHGEYPLALNLGWTKGQFQHHGGTWISGIQENLSGGTRQSRDSLNKGVWDCPSAAKPADWPQKTVYRHYGYNGNGLGMTLDQASLGLGGRFAGFGAGYAPPVKSGDVISPSDCMAIGDGFHGWNGVIQDGRHLLWRWNLPTTDQIPGSTSRSRKRHGGRANVVFCDGHVEAPLLDSLFVETSDASLRRWNRDGQPHRERLNP